MKILILDDDQNLLSMLVPHLEYQGHTVLLAVNGMEFMQKAQAYRVDLFISDINLPVGPGGDELYRQVRALPGYAETPFLLWSGIEFAKGESIAAADPRARFVKKPFSIKLLQQAIDEVKDMPPFADDGRQGGGLKL